MLFFITIKKKKMRWDGVRFWNKINGHVFLKERWRVCQGIIYFLSLSLFHFYSLFSPSLTQKFSNKKEEKEEAVLERDFVCWNISKIKSTLNKRRRLFLFLFTWCCKRRRFLLVITHNFTILSSFLDIYLKKKERKRFKVMQIVFVG